jgi:hypothetical protein
MLGKVNKNGALMDLRKPTGEGEICIGIDCYTVINHLTSSERLHWAQDYVYDELVSMGYPIEIQDWSLPTIILK